MTYYKDENNKLYIDAILDNHTGLEEITKSEFDTQLEINNTLTVVQLLEIEVAEKKAYLKLTDFKMAVDYYDTMTTSQKSELVNNRAIARDFVRENEV